jgi:hypothetical protein
MLQADDVEPRVCICTDIGHAAFVGDRDRYRRHQPLGLQFFASEADHHHLAAEVRVQADVAQRADRNLRSRRLDRYPATIGMLEADHIIDVRVTVAAARP